MALQPEQAQKLTDLRQHMLKNIQEGKPAHDGLTPERIKEALSFLRSNAASVMAHKEKAAKAKLKKQQKQKEVVDISTFFGGFDFD